MQPPSLLVSAIATTIVAFGGFPAAHGSSFDIDQANVIAGIPQAIRDGAGLPAGPRSAQAHLGGVFQLQQAGSANRIGLEVTGAATGSAQVTVNQNGFGNTADLRSSAPGSAAPQALVSQVGDGNRALFSSQGAHPQASGNTRSGVTQAGRNNTATVIADQATGVAAPHLRVRQSREGNTATVRSSIPSGASSVSVHQLGGNETVTVDMSGSSGTVQVVTDGGARGAEVRLSNATATSVMAQVANESLLDLSIKDGATNNVYVSLRGASSGGRNAAALAITGAANTVDVDIAGVDTAVGSSCAGSGQFSCSLPAEITGDRNRLKVGPGSASDPNGGLVYLPSGSASPQRTTFDITITGSDNRALLAASGADNSLLLRQNGDQNSAVIAVSGDRNRAEIRQDSSGAGNAASLRIIGNDNTLTLNQMASASRQSSGLAITGSGVTARVTEQNGNRTISLSGAGAGLSFNPTAPLLVPK